MKLNRTHKGGGYKTTIQGIEVTIEKQSYGKWTAQTFEVMPDGEYIDFESGTLAELKQALIVAEFHAKLDAEPATDNPAPDAGADAADDRLMFCKVCRRTKPENGSGADYCADCEAVELAELETRRELVLPLPVIACDVCGTIQPTWKDAAEHCPAAETETAAPVADDPAEYLDADEFAAAVGLTDGEMMRAEREDAERRAAAAVRCPIGACSTVPCMHSGDGEPWDLDR